jgi:hypothetical protein
MENKYTQYDNVVNTVMTNILVERERCGKYILYDFQPSNDADKLYFNVAAIAADLNKEKIYLGMPLLDFIFFWKKRRKKRHNLRWLNPIQKKKLSDEDKTSVSIIMDFICVQLKLNYRLFKEINDEYYGWID